MIKSAECNLNLNNTCDVYYTCDTEVGDRSKRKALSSGLEHVSPSLSSASGDGHLHTAFSPGATTHR